MTGTYTYGLIIFKQNCACLSFLCWLSWHVRNMRVIRYWVFNYLNLLPTQNERQSADDNICCKYIWLYIVDTYIYFSYCRQIQTYCRQLDTYVRNNKTKQPISRSFKLDRKFISLIGRYKNIIRYIIPQRGKFLKPQNCAGSKKLLPWESFRWNNGESSGKLLGSLFRVVYRF